MVGVRTFDEGEPPMTATLAVLGDLRRWPPRRWAVAAGVALLSGLLIAVPTDLVDTPWFGRDVSVTSWAWPGLVASSVLAGLLAATYVGVPAQRPAVPHRGTEAAGRRGLVGSVLTLFAVGCPVCNKVVLLALGYSGALTWFAPLQPLLQVSALALLGWALLHRVRGERACPVPSTRRPVRAL